jgi:hypothetical protein
MKTAMACLLLLFPTFVLGAGLKLHTAKPGGVPTQVYVQFETPVALSDCDVEFPSRKTGCTSVAPPWEVVIYDAGGTPIQNTVVAAVDPIGHFPANGLVTLTLQDPIIAGYSRVDITFSKGNAPHISIENSATPTKKVFSAAKTKDDSSVYVSGTFSPAVGTSPSYTIDSKGQYGLLSFGKNRTSTLSATGDINTDNKKTADPDSFHWATPVQHVSERPYTEQWSLIGMELNKKGNAINIVSSPSVTGSIGHAFFYQDRKHGGVEAVAASIGLDLTAGIEFGTNVRNQYAITNKSLAGEGWFFRGAPAAIAYLIIPQVLHLSRISLTSSYVARIPTTHELFLETRHTKTPLPELTSKTRHYVQNTLSFMFTDYFGIQVKHQYGSLPPAFNFVQNSGSVGLVFAFKQTRVP